MILSDLSVKRPVLATVFSLLLLLLGGIAFWELPLREYPDINPPVVSVETTYEGASAKVIESRITRLVEDRVAGVEGIDTISSTSEDGKSNVTIEFGIGRDIDAAANDVRDRVARVIDQLPEEADPPEIVKIDSNTSVIMWLNLSSTVLDTRELTDYAERYLVDRFSTLDGVARVVVGGGRRYAMRVWLDPVRLAARDLTVSDVEAALRRENLELPAGRIESVDREFTVRLERAYVSADDFAAMVISRGDAGGDLIRLGDVARVEEGSRERRTWFRGNGESMVGIGLVKQSTANTLAVAKAGQLEGEAVRKVLPPGTTLHQSYDSSVFIDGAISEVWVTLGIAILLVVGVIFVFLGTARATIVPALTVPIALVASFIALYALGFSINLFTLLALVLAIGLIVDDTIVVVENIYRRIEEGEPPLLAAFHGSREVAFAVVATTIVLVAVFVPLAFLDGNIGRLFVEFAAALCAAVICSSLVALTLSPMLCSKLLSKSEPNLLARGVDRMVGALDRVYRVVLGFAIKRAGWVLLIGVAALGGTVLVGREVPSEFAPQEDRGAFFIKAVAPEGASYEYMLRWMGKVEADMLTLIESGEAERALARVPGSFNNTSVVNSGFGIVLLKQWAERERSANEVMNDIRAKIAKHPGVRAFAFARQGLGRQSSGRPVNFVIGGPTYTELAAWRDRLMTEIRKYPGLVGPDFDYKETKPQIIVKVDRDRAADLGVPYREVGRTLETLFGGRRVTTYESRGEEYDVMLEAELDQKKTVTDLERVYVRSTTSGALVPLASIITHEELADAPQLQRFNRTRAITLEADLGEGVLLGEALDWLSKTARDVLPPEAVFDYKGQSREFRQSGDSLIFTFLLALGIVFLVLAAQFESFIHPLVIMLTVPMALAGALLGLWLAGDSLNIYSQIGIVMLIGLSAKNGILIVEFANQLRDRGIPFAEALETAARTRLRPILMTGISTAIGAVPLLLASGAGAETRRTIGIVIFAGVMVGTAFTLIIVPAAYSLLARRTGAPGDVARKIEALEAEQSPAT